MTHHRYVPTRARREGNLDACHLVSSAGREADGWGLGSPTPIGGVGVKPPRIDADAMRETTDDEVAAELQRDLRRLALHFGMQIARDTVDRDLAGPEIGLRIEERVTHLADALREGGAAPRDVEIVERIYRLELLQAGRHGIELICDNAGGIA